MTTQDELDFDDDDPDEEQVSAAPRNEGETTEIKTHGNGTSLNQQEGEITQRRGRRRRKNRLWSNSNNKDEDSVDSILMTKHEDDIDKKKGNSHYSNKSPNKENLDKSNNINNKKEGIPSQLTDDLDFDEDDENNNNKNKNDGKRGDWESNREEQEMETIAVAKQDKRRKRGKQLLSLSMNEDGHEKTIEETPKSFSSSTGSNNHHKNNKINNTHRKEHHDGLESPPTSGRKRRRTTITTTTTKESNIPLLQESKKKQDEDGETKVEAEGKKDDEDDETENKDNTCTATIPHKNNQKDSSVQDIFVDKRAVPSSYSTETTTTALRRSTRQPSSDQSSATPTTTAASSSSRRLRRRGNTRSSDNSLSTTITTTTVPTLSTAPPSLQRRRSKTEETPSSSLSASGGGGEDPVLTSQLTSITSGTMTTRTKSNSTTTTRSSKGSSNSNSSRSQHGNMTGRKEEEEENDHDHEEDTTSQSLRSRRTAIDSSHDSLSSPAKRQRQNQTTKSTGNTTSKMSSSMSELDFVEEEQDGTTTPSKQQDELDFDDDGAEEEEQDENTTTTLTSSKSGWSRLDVSSLTRKQTSLKSSFGGGEEEDDARTPSSNPKSRRSQGGASSTLFGGAESSLSSFFVGRTRSARLKTTTTCPKETTKGRPKKKGILTTTVHASGGEDNADSTAGLDETGTVRFARCAEEDNIWTAASGGTRNASSKQQPLSSLSSSAASSSALRRKKSRKRFPQSSRRLPSKSSSVNEDEDPTHLFPQPLEPTGVVVVAAGVASSSSSSQPPQPPGDWMMTDDGATSATARGVGVDVYDLQDNGQLQLLTDEVSFLCDGMWHNPRATSSALELAWLLSLERNRQILWKSTTTRDGNKNNSNNNNGGSGTGTALKLVLDLLAHLPWSLDSQVPSEFEDMDDENLVTESNNDAKTEKSNADALLPLVLHDTYQVSLQRIVEVLWHFVSRDCTWASSPAALQRARSLRLAILSHEKALAGIVQLALSQKGPSLPPETKDTEERNGSKQLGEVSVPVPPTKAINDNSTGSLAIAPSASEIPASPESLASQGSQSSRVSADPTIAGRKRRRGRPRTTQMHASSQTQNPLIPPPSLSVIQEEEHVEGNANDDKKIAAFKRVDDGTKNDLSYSSSLSSTNIHALGNYGRDASTRYAIQQEQWAAILKRVLGTMGKDYDKKRHATCATFTVNMPLSRENEQRAKSGPQHACIERNGHRQEQKQSLPHNLALLSLQRILTGRMEGHEKSCLDESHIKKDKGQGSNDDDEDESNNPIIVTNRLLAGKEQAIVLLSKAMGQAVAEATTLAGSKTDKLHDLCIETLHERISILASIIDGACLFHDVNRLAFCSASFIDSNETKCSLVPHLVAFLKAMLNRTDADDCSTSLFCGSVSWMGGTGLEVLKTLTSLTHENQEAVAAVAEAEGWQVLAQLLFDHGAVLSLPNRHDDLAIFALNTLANLVESSASAPADSSSADQLCYTNIAIQLQVRKRGNDDETISFLSWLVKHLVDLTASFRDELGDEDHKTSMSSSLPSEPENVMDEAAFLDHDRDNLLLAGNGFVFLAYLLVGTMKKKKNTDASSSLSFDTAHPDAMALEGMVLNELPGTTYTSKIRFLQKVLYAFCNFYRHTVGELSVAIIAPVQSLMQVLSEKVQRIAAGEQSNDNHI